MVPARSAAAALKALDVLRPAAIVLDIRLHGEESWDLLARLKQQRATADVPVLVVLLGGRPHKALALGADAYQAKPVDAALAAATRSICWSHAPGRAASS